MEKSFIALTPGRTLSTVASTAGASWGCGRPKSRDCWGWPGSAGRSRSFPELTERPASEKGAKSVRKEMIVRLGSYHRNLIIHRMFFGS